MTSQTGGDGRLPAHLEVSRTLSRPADAAVVPLLPHTNGLVLIGEMQTAVEVVSLHDVISVSVIILSATFGSKKLRVASVLGDLNRPLTRRGPRIANLKVQRVALRR